MSIESVLSEPRETARFLAELGVYTEGQISETLAKSGKVTREQARQIASDAMIAAAEVHRREAAGAMADQRSIDAEHDLSRKE